MAKYGRKPKIIEAFKFIGGKQQMKYPAWIEDEIKKGNIYEIGDSINGITALKIEYPKGVITADRGDYIVQGEKGQIGPCKPDIFDKIYEDVGEISDGHHTFNELYYHRMILFSVICNMNRSKAWKSWKHHDGSMYNDYFIVGIDTPEGQYSYHYHKEHWDMFNVEELENAPEWDGHEPKDINRLISLIQEVNKDCGSKNIERFNEVAIICDGKETILHTPLEMDFLFKNISEFIKDDKGFLFIRDHISGKDKYFNLRKITMIKYIATGIKVLEN